MADAAAKAALEGAEDIFNQHADNPKDSTDTGPMLEKMDDKIRHHVNECGKPMSAEMKVVKEGFIRMDSHMRQVKWLIMAAIVALLANGGIGKFLASIMPVPRAHSSLPSADAGVPAGSSFSLVSSAQAANNK